MSSVLLPSRQDNAFHYQAKCYDVNIQKTLVL